MEVSKEEALKLNKELEKTSKIQKEVKKRWDEEERKKEEEKKRNQQTKKSSEITIKKLTDKEKQKLLRDYNVWEEKFNKKGELEKGKIILPNLGDLIYNELNLSLLTLEDNEEIYAYNGGYYEPYGEHIIKNLVEQFLDEESNEHRKNEVVGHIRDKNYQDRSIFNPPLNLINFKNGVYDLNTGKLLPHSPEYYFITEIPVNYDPDAGYEEFEKFLKQICSVHHVKERPEIVDTLQEYMGYCFYRAYPYKSYVVLDGSGDNGKTTWMDILLSMVGEKNNTSVSLQELNTRPFTKSQLFGMLTNISDDLPKKGLVYSGVIKQVTGNSSIWADIKNHPKGINFIPYAKPVYACNELPPVTDYTDAFFARQLQITLLNKYLVKGSPEIDNETVFERDDTIYERLTTPEKLSGMVNYALEGLKRLREQGHFTIDKHRTTEEKRETWIRKTNPTHAFITDEIETGNEDWCITVDDFFDEVVAFCERNNFDKPTSRHIITRKMNEEGGMRRQQKTINGQQRVWCWVGIKSTTNSLINHYIGRNEEMKKIEGEQQRIESQEKENNNTPEYKRVDKTIFTNAEELDIKQTIKENPEDNYTILVDKYGSDRIDEGIELGILAETILGKKLEFVERSGGGES